MKVKIDREKCIGCGTCSALVPEYFELDDEGKAVLKNPGMKLDDELKEKIRIAAQSCADNAILVSE